MISNHGLIIISGESFREGNQYSRLIDTEWAYDQQKLASESHIKFIDIICQKYDSSIDLYINTYNTKYQNDLNEWYSKYHAHITYHDQLLPHGTSQLAAICLDTINNLHKYDWILFLRPDLLLKEYFYEIFDPFSPYVLYPNRLWIFWHTLNNGFMNINDTMLFVPKKSFHILLSRYVGLYHDGLYNYIHKHHLNLKDFDFMIPTLHDSDSYKDYNPLYTMCGRPANMHWHSYGYEVDKANNFEIRMTHKPYVFADWSLLLNNIPRQEYNQIINIDNLWEWWHQDPNTMFRFHNIIELNTHNIFGQRTLLSRHPDQTYWGINDDKSISMYHNNYTVSTVLKPVSDHIYIGSYNFNSGINFMIKKYQHITQ